MSDNVNHPTHYSDGWSNGAEIIDITEHLNFNLGNVVKYVTRAGRKSPDPVEDLRKAQWYLSRELERYVPQPRHWTLLDNVPAGIVVSDRDGDYYRRVSGTGKFETSYVEQTHGQHYEWQKVSSLFYKHQGDFSPYTEVTT